MAESGDLLVTLPLGWPLKKLKKTGRGGEGERVEVELWGGRDSVSKGLLRSGREVVAGLMGSLQRCH